MPFDSDENPWSAWVSQHFPGTFAHPDAPDGGSGYGYSRVSGECGVHAYEFEAPDPHSPEGMHIMPWEAAERYAVYEFEKVRAGLRQVLTWDVLRELAERALGPKSFALGVCYGILQNPTMSVVGLVQLQKVFVEADLYERMTRPRTWKTLLAPTWMFGGPTLFELGEIVAMKTGVLNLDGLKRSYDMREALINEVGQLFSHPVDFIEQSKDKLSATSIDKWNRFCLLQKQTDLKSQFEAGEILGDLVMEVVMLILTVMSVAGAAAKLAAKISQLVRVAEFVRGARAAEAGGVAEEAAETMKVQRLYPSSARDLAVIKKESILLPKKPEGTLEPGAISGTMPKNTPVSPEVPDDWPDSYKQISTQEISSFQGQPKPDVLPPNTKIYRVIGKGNNPNGSFWTVDPPPGTEAEWRSGYAIKHSFSGDGGYVEDTVGAEGLRVLRGPIAPQEAGQPGKYLPGGHEQLWVPSNTIKAGMPKPTPWNL